MNFENIKKIKDAVESFKNVQLYSIINENEILIQHVNTQAVYKISYSESEDGSIVFNTTDSEQLEDKIINEEVRPIEEFKQNANVITESIKNIFSNDYDGAVKSLKDVIINIPSIDQKAINEDIELKKEENISEYAPWIESVFGEKIQKYQEAQREFEKTFNIFDEEGDIIQGEFVDLNIVKATLKQVSESYDAFKENAAKFGDLKEKVNDVFEDEKKTDVFFEGFDFAKDIKVNVTKNLVKMNRTFNDEINMVETTKQLVAILESNMSPVNGANMPATYNMAADNKFQPKFFKFKMGMFTAEDIKTMINEIDFYISSYDALNEEDLQNLYGVKHQLEYMYHSGQINDHLIQEILESFNSKYAKDKSDDYQDAAKQLAWKSKDQMKENNAQGFAIGGASI